jgi:hypothetical protein
MAKLNSGTRIYGNVTIDTFVTATGNITGGNIITTGVVKTTTLTVATLPAAATVGDRKSVV